VQEMEKEMSTADEIKSEPVQRKRGPSNPAQGRSQAGIIFASALVFSTTTFLVWPTTVRAAELGPLHQQCAATEPEPAKAIAACTSLIESNADSDRNTAVSYVNRAVAWTKNNRPDQAAADLARAMRIWPSYERSYYVRGNLFLKSDDVGRAVADFSQAIAINASYAPAYSGRAFAHIQMKDFDRAIAEANTAIRIDPRLAIAYVARGTALSRKRELERALGDLGYAIQLNLHLPIAYNNRGFVYKTKGDLDRAITDFTQAVEIDPGYVLPFRNRAAAWRDTGQFGRVIEDLNKVISLGTRESNVFNDRGLAYFNTGNLDRGVQDFDQAIALDHKNVSALINRGLTYEKKGNRASALADFNAALVIDANRSDAQAARTRVSSVGSALASVAPAVARSAPSTTTTAGEPTAQGRTASSASGNNWSSAQPTRSDPINANAQIQAPAAAASRPLHDALAACGKSGKPQTGLVIVQSNGKGKLPLPVCYRGRAHLDCVVSAMVDEATAISREYEAIVNSNYPNMNDVAAICKIDPRQIEEHVAKAMAFDARAAALQSAYNSSATCVDNVHKTLTAIDLSSMKNSQALLRSILETTTVPLEQASARQRDVIRLMQAIKDAQNSMTAVQSIRGSVCR
jgi:tetratricopeptide (TPR) repeat protein